MTETIYKGMNAYLMTLDALGKAWTNRPTRNHLAVRLLNLEAR